MEKNLTLGQMLEELARDDGIKGSSNIDHDSVANHHSVEAFGGRSRDHRVELDAGDAATEAILQERTGGAPAASDLEDLAALSVKIRENVLPNLAIVINELVAKSSCHGIQGRTFTGEDRGG